MRRPIRLQFVRDKLVIFSAFLLVSCLPSPATPSPAVSPIRPTTAAVTPTLSAPTNRMDTPTPFPPATRSIDAVPLDTLLFQNGDLPADIQPGVLDRDPPQWMQMKLPSFDGAAGLDLTRPGMPYGVGRAQLLFDRDESRVANLYEQILGFEAPQRQGVPQPGIGDVAMFFPAQTADGPMLLLFRRCRTVVDIHLWIAPTDEPAMLNYASRLAQRIDAVDCQGAARAPVLTPPPPQAIATWTPTTVPATIAVAQVISPTVARLPDPSGAYTIRASAFADADHGWLAVGAHILATDDGGRTWIHRFDADSQVQGIGFVSASLGWIEMQQGVLVTTDGGRTWQPGSKPDDGRMPRPPTTSADNGDPMYSFCPKETPFAGPFAAIDRQTAWALCTSAASAHYLGGIGLYKTSNGGETWQWVTDQVPHWSYGISALFFLDQQHGWLASSTDTDGSVQATLDGGRTWTTIAAGGREPRDIQFLSPKVGFVVFPFLLSDGNQEVLTRTDDGGKTWQTIYTVPPRAPWPAGPTQFFSDGGGIGAGDGYYGYAGNESNNTILSTKDAGRSWTTLSVLRGDCPGNYAANAISLSFADNRNGWLVLACAVQPLRTIYATKDGGLTWQAMEGAAAVYDAQALSFVTLETGYVVGQSGRLWRTDDGGGTFTLVDEAQAHTPSLRFATSTLGWEIRGAELYETVDGGRDWSLIPIGYPVQEFSLRPDGQAWVVVGDTAPAGDPAPSHRFFATRDRGRTWTEYRLGDIPSNWRYPWLDGIQFADTRQGWLKADTQMYVTEDGGLNWIQLR